MTESAEPTLLGASEIRALAASLNSTPTKKLGQNFVIDPNTVRRIVTQAHVCETDVVVEIGPGLGSLTLALLPNVAKVLAVEIDPVLAGALPATIALHAPNLKDNLTVINADAMRIDNLPLDPTHLVANLPYNVSVPVVLHFLETFPSLKEILVNGGGAYVDDQIENWVEAVCVISTNPEIRKSALENSRNYSWQKTAGQLLALYQLTQLEKELVA